MIRNTKIALVGSSKLKEVIMKFAKDLEMSGNVVLCSHIFSHADKYELTKRGLNNAVKNGHKRIDMADIVICVMQKWHIGDNSREEIMYAYRQNKMVFYYLYESDSLSYNCVMSNSFIFNKASVILPNYRTNDIDSIEEDEIFDIPISLSILTEDFTSEVHDDFIVDPNTKADKETTIEEHKQGYGEFTPPEDLTLTMNGGMGF